MRNKLLLSLVGIAVIAGAYFLYNSQSERTIKPRSDNFASTTGNYPPAKKPLTVVLQNNQKFDLTAGIVSKEINGEKIKMLAYNGSIPGPVIKVKQGSEITVNFKNNTDIDSTIHSHGVRVDNKFDGAVDVTQKAVKVGETFTYKLKFPDAGVYWYHPHFREDYSQEMGLYGNFIVEPKDRDYYSSVNREIPLVLDDILLEDGSTAPFSRKISTHTLMGRFGNTLLVNGETEFSQKVNANEVVRFYLTNAANARIFNFTIPGAKMKLVGGDNGKYEKEIFSPEILLGPSERAIVDVLFETPGEYQLQNKTPENIYILGSINVNEAPVKISYAKEFNTLRANHEIMQVTDALRSYIHKSVDKSLILSLDMNGMNSSTQGGQDMHMMHNGTMMKNSEMTDTEPAKIEWEDNMGMMNVMSNSEMVKWKLVDRDTNKTNMDIDWQFKKGDRIKIKIFNDPRSRHPMQHPIHIHGQRFLVLSTNEEPNQNLVWKDTALIQTGDTVELLVEMDNPGTWMIHCHIPEHMESGMQAKFRVI